MLAARLMDFTRAGAFISQTTRAYRHNNFIVQASPIVYYKDAAGPAEGRFTQAGALT